MAMSTPWIASLALAAACLPARAQTDGRCPASVSASQLLGERATTLARFERVPDACLEIQFLDCSREASERLLDLGDAAVCSAAYESLLRRKFNGDFKALLAWWRELPPSAVANRR